VPPCTSATCALVAVVCRAELAGRCCSAGRPRPPRPGDRHLDARGNRGGGWRGTARGGAPPAPRPPCLRARQGDQERRRRRADEAVPGQACRRAYPVIGAMPRATTSCSTAPAPLCAPPTLQGVGGVPSSASARSGCGVLFGPSPRAITCRVCRRVLASPPGIDQHTTGPLSVREAFPSRCSSRANARSGRAVHTVSGMGEVGVPCLSGYVPCCSGRIQRGGRSENLDSE